MEKLNPHQCSSNGSGVAMCVRQGAKSEVPDILLNHVLETVHHRASGSTSPMVRSLTSQRNTGNDQARRAN